jgi:hypothetical protein
MNAPATDAFSRFALDGQQFPNMQPLIAIGGKKKSAKKPVKKTARKKKTAPKKKVAKKTGKK